MKRIGLPLLICASYCTADVNVQWSVTKNNYALTFEKPTQYTDGTEIPDNGISGYRVVCSDPVSIRKLGAMLDKYSETTRFFYDKSFAPTFVNYDPAGNKLDTPLVIKYVDAFVPVSDTFETGAPPNDAGTPINDKIYVNWEFGIPSFTGIKYGTEVSCGVATVTSNGATAQLSLPTEAPLFTYTTDSAPSKPALSQYKDLEIKPMVMPLEPGRPIKRLSMSVAWGRPVTTENGKDLAYKELAYYKLYCGPTNNPEELRENLRTRPGRNRYSMDLSGKVRITDKYCGLTILDGAGRESKMAISQAFSAGACNLPKSRPRLKFKLRPIVSVN